MSKKTTRNKPIGFDSIHRHFRAGHATVAQTGWRCRRCGSEIWLPDDWQEHQCRTAEDAEGTAEKAEVGDANQE